MKKISTELIKYENIFYLILNKVFCKIAIWSQRKRKIYFNFLEVCSIQTCVLYLKDIGILISFVDFRLAK